MAFVHRFQEGSVWVIDPIDGTNNFVTQKEDFAVMVAYFEDGIGQFGHSLRCDAWDHMGWRIPVYRNEG